MCPPHIKIESNNVLTPNHAHHSRRMNMAKLLKTNSSNATSRWKSMCITTYDKLRQGKPADPTNLGLTFLTCKGEQKVRFSWDLPDTKCIKHFLIQRTYGKNPPEQIGKVIDKNHTSVNIDIQSSFLTNEYTYEIKSIGFGANSEPKSFPKFLPPAIPTNIKGVPSSTSIKLTWKAGDCKPNHIYTKSYTITYKQYTDTNPQTVSNILDTTYTVNNLSPGTKYNFKIRAINGSDLSDYSLYTPYTTSGGDPKLYVVGGTTPGNANTNPDPGDDVLKSVECFDPLTGNWSSGVAMKTARAFHGVAVVDDNMYAVGGEDGDNIPINSVEYFDPSTKDWIKVVVPMKIARASLGVAVVDGKMYAVGGADDAFTPLNSVECFDPSTKYWSSVVAPMSTARADHGVAVVDGKIYAVGGQNNKKIPLKGVECFDPLTGYWSSGVADMKTARENVAVAVVDGKMYAVGGGNDDNNSLKSVECFDPSTVNWTLVAPMSTARAYHGVAVVDGKMYAVGGKNEYGTILKSVECFDPSTGNWTLVAPMSTARYAHGVSIGPGQGGNSAKPSPDAIKTCSNNILFQKKTKFNTPFELTTYKTTGSRGILGDISYPRNQNGRWNTSITNTKLYPVISMYKDAGASPPDTTLKVAKQSGNIFKSTTNNMSKKQLYSYLSKNPASLHR